MTDVFTYNLSCYTFASTMTEKLTLIAYIMRVALKRQCLIHS